ncbi:TetR/AcrR family transcriptional regulator [Actinomadura rudentiformis]|uniref:TetR/AcrR family transcriptional regulator n=1 Tax=Actinomadura rudentiformis TaxID=359158 RepID=A0A6H9Z0T1_9ACTN|nr:TetR/AcrR family transcriptional regulator [Actinomadura rudentiformis]KAB2346596.1 TetR/AcrR family transcriptional regulator [Actinomadura rudentiformis]
MAELRADARRNRDLLLEAARQLIVERGGMPPLEDIAQRAGVGIGTLYRRFPDREDLMIGISAHTMRRVVEIAQTAWDEEPDGWSALSRFVRRCIELRMGVLGTTVDPVLHAKIRHDPEVIEARGRLVELLALMVEGAQTAGVMRGDVGPGDIGMLINVHIHQAADIPAALVDVVPGRLVGLMLDGLRARPGTPLPGRAISGADLEAQ